VERVRARKEGGPDWNDENPKVFVTQYPPERAGEIQREGFPDQFDTTPTTSPPPPLQGGGEFVVEEDEDEDEGESHGDNGAGREHRYGSLADDENPWGR